MTEDDFLKEMSRIRLIIETRGDLEKMIILENNSGDKNEVTDRHARVLLDETWDMIESPLFAYAMKDCIEVSFRLMRMDLTPTVFKGSEDLPLAQILTRLKYLLNGFYEE